MFLPHKNITPANWDNEGDYWDMGSWIWDWTSNPQAKTLVRWIRNTITGEIKLAIKGGTPAPAGGENHPNPMPI